MTLADVTVIAAFYKPPVAVAARQLESLRQQTGVRLSIVAVLDGSETAADGALRELLEQHGCRIVVLPEQRGVRQAFMAGLDMALSIAAGGDGLFAYCDQDDQWRTNKLARCAEALRQPGVSLAHCDARITDDDGNLIAASLHRYESRQEPATLLDILLLNSVTGMTAMFGRAVAELAARLNRRYGGNMLHDHVTAIAAACLGRIAYVDEPLADYVQHGANQIGAKLHIAWRSRALGIAHAAAYRQTSAALFDERREMALLLADEGLLPWTMKAMFVTNARPGLIALVISCDMAMIRLAATGQFRRAMLVLRMLDAGFFFVLRGDHKLPPEK